MGIIAKIIITCMLFILAVSAVSAVDLSGDHTLLYNLTFETGNIATSNFTTIGTGSNYIIKSTGCKVGTKCLSQQADSAGAGQQTAFYIQSSLFTITNTSEYIIRGWFKGANASADTNDGFAGLALFINSSTNNYQMVGWNAWDDPNYKGITNGTVISGTRRASQYYFAANPPQENVWVWCVNNITSTWIRFACYTDSTESSLIVQNQTLTQPEWGNGYWGFQNYRDVVYDNIEFYQINQAPALPGFSLINLTSSTPTVNCTNKYATDCVTSQGATLTDDTPTFAVTLNQSATGVKIQNTDSSYSTVSGTKYSCTGSDGYNWSCTWQTSLTKGQHDLYFSWTTAANESISPLPNINKVRFTVTDNVPPTLENFTIAPSSPVTYNNTFHISAISKTYDLNGISRAWITVNGTSYFASNSTGSDTWNVTLPNLGAGVYSYYWSTNDTSGNLNQSSTSSYTINKATPGVIITLDNGNVNKTINFGQSYTINCTLTNITDGTSSLGTNIYKNGTLDVIGSNPNMTQTYTPSTLGITTHYCSWPSGSQNFTNAVSTSMGVTTIDNVPPVVSLVYPNDSASMSGTSVNLSWITTDNYYSSTICNATINGTIYSGFTTNNNTVTNKTATGLTDGTYNWNVACGDGSGNAGTSATRSFNIDSTGPTCNQTDIIPSSGTYSPLAQYNFSIHCVDPSGIGMVNLSVDGFNITNVNGSAGWYTTTITGLPLGYYNATWVSSDIFGQTTTTISPYNVTNFGLASCGNYSSYPYQTLNATIMSSSGGSKIPSNSIVALNAQYLSPLTLTNYAFNFTNTSNWAICSNTKAGLTVNASISYQDIAGNYSANVYEISGATWNNNTQYLNLYLVGGTIPIVITVIDSVGRPVAGAQIQVLMNFNGTGYATTSSLLTGYDGKTVANLVGYTTWYRFDIIQNGVTKLSTSPMLITANTITFNLPEDNSFMMGFQTYLGTSCVTYYNNNTGNMRLDWTGSGNVAGACLTLTKDDIIQHDILLNSSCQTGPSGTILLPVAISNSSSDYVITGTGSITVNGTTFQCGNPAEVRNNDSIWKTYNVDGILISFFIVLTMFAMGIWNPVFSILLGIIALIVVNILQFYVMSIPILAGVAIVLGIVMWRLRQK